MNLSKPNENTRVYWQERIADVVEANGCGISSNFTQTYKTEKAKLSQIVTSDETLHQKVNSYISKLISLHNLRLYLYYAQSTNDPMVISFYQSAQGQYRVRRLEEKIENDVRKAFSEVLKELEKYQTGGAIE